MTPEDREKILRYRQEHGYPLHGPPHPYRQEGYYFISAANYDHYPVMASPERRTDFESRLLSTMAGINADVSAWVIMPNHYHVLIGVESLECVSVLLKQLHGQTSHDWNTTDQLTARRRVWYKFSDRMIRSERHFYQAINYIHYNPVKHGYVADPYDWEWISLHEYFEVYGREWLREKWVAYPPGDLGCRWDI